LFVSVAHALWVLHTDHTEAHLRVVTPREVFVQYMYKISINMNRLPRRRGRARGPTRGVLTSGHKSFDWRAHMLLSACETQTRFALFKFRWY